MLTHYQVGSSEVHDPNPSFLANVNHSAYDQECHTMRDPSVSYTVVRRHTVNNTLNTEHFISSQVKVSELKGFSDPRDNELRIALGEIDILIDDFRSAPMRDIQLALLSIFAPHKRGNYISMTVHANPGKANYEIFGLTFYKDGRVTYEKLYFQPMPYAADFCTLIVRSIFTKIGCSPLKIAHDRDPYDPGWIIELGVNDLEITLDDLNDCHTSLRQKICIPSDIDADTDSQIDLLHAVKEGNTENIIGTKESRTLEFKSQVDLDSEAGKVELAQDIARFANEEEAATIIVGVRTKRREGQDVATKIVPLDATKHTVKRYQDIIDSRVYPPIRGLEISQVETTENRVLIIISIPSQRQDERPFLVHGAIVDGKVEGVFFSVVRRRGEGSIPVTAREIHAQLAAGYRLSRGINRRE
jgi:hypothetical protein